MRGGVGSDMTSLQGAKSLNDIEDVKYLRDKLVAAIKIPQSCLTNLEGGAEDKTTLAQKDISFENTLQKLHTILCHEIKARLRGSEMCKKERFHSKWKREKLK